MSTHHCAILLSLSNLILFGNVNKFNISTLRVLLVSRVLCKRDDFVIRLENVGGNFANDGGDAVVDDDDSDD